MKCIDKRRQPWGSSTSQACAVLATQPPFKPEGHLRFPACGNGWDRVHRLALDVEGNQGSWQTCIESGLEKVAISPAQSAQVVALSVCWRRR